MGTVIRNYKVAHDEIKKCCEQLCESGPRGLEQIMGIHTKSESLPQISLMKLCGEGTNTYNIIKK